MEKIRNKTASLKLESISNDPAVARILFPIVSHPQTIEKSFCRVDPFNQAALLSLHLLPLLIVRGIRVELSPGGGSCRGNLAQTCANHLRAFNSR
ncbi:MAG: hypothetical protein DME19_11740 [Verrucomicrobia bacterium]|nr:MAG: hypothetical protein DME19_11740 [Verrucomicrobiota bacterium]